MSLTKLLKYATASATLAAILIIILELSLPFWYNPIQDKPKPITKYSYTKEKECLKELLWYESRNTTTKEMNAVLDVAINRYKNSNFPNDLCSIVQQDKQYSYRNNLKDKSKNILPELQNVSGKSDRLAYLNIEEIVESRFQSDSILPNKVLPENALFYHTKSIKNKPKWSRSEKVKQIEVDRSFQHRYYSVVRAVR